MNQELDADESGSQMQQEQGDDVLEQLSATATTSKVDKLMTDFASFDEVMRIGTRVSVCIEDGNGVVLTTLLCACCSNAKRKMNTGSPRCGVR